MKDDIWAILAPGSEKGARSLGVRSFCSFFGGDRFYYENIQVQTDLPEVAVNPHIRVCGFRIDSSIGHNMGSAMLVMTRWQISPIIQWQNLDLKNKTKTSNKEKQQT